MQLARTPICDRVRGQISLELDGELSQLECAMVAKHIERCPACAAFRDNTAALTDALRFAPLEQLEQPLTLPSLRRTAYAELRSNAIRVAAAAAGIAIVLNLGLSNSGHFSSDALRSRPTLSTAYLQSMDYERQLMRQQADRSNGSRTNTAV
jgi:predicted anti-sigma-YlaC factor YlaD